MSVFDLFYLAMTPVVAPLLAYKALRRGKYRESAPAMLGRYIEQEDAAMWANGSLWVHAVSFGEVVAAKAMLPLLREQYPQWPLLLTTVTETGQSLARSLVPKQADASRYYPMDFSWVVKRFVQTYHPRILVLMETELWPNALRIASGYGTKIFVMNGKISDKSYPSYMRLRRFMHAPLSRITAFCMQTDEDARRISDLCSDASRVFVTGNCKLDVPIPEVSPQERNELRELCGVQPHQKILVFGSTHPGEEEIALEAFKQVLRLAPDTVLVLVPRHPERFALVWDLIASKGFAARRLSDGAVCGSASPMQVVLVDRMGLLAKLYAVADVAAIAGSFVPGIGGHNLLEAAAHGIPVVYGPYTDKQPDMVRILEESKGGIATPAPELASTLSRLLTDLALAKQTGHRGRQAWLSNQGAARKNMEVLLRFINGTGQL